MDDDRTEVEGGGVGYTRRGLFGVFAALAAIAGTDAAFALPFPGRKPVQDARKAESEAEALDALLPGRKPPRSGRGGRTSRAVRAVNLYNVNTGERIRAPYWQDGRYIGETMRQVQRMMRDHRSGEQHRIDPLLVDLLCAMQMRIGAAKPIEIVSGYRSPQTNEALRNAGYGVAEHSYHCLGKAVDIRVPGYRVSQLSKMAKVLRRGGVGTYGSGNFLHIDTGPVRYW